MLERGVVLEHEADAPVLGRDAGGVLAQDQDAAGVGLLEARDHSQKRRLAAAARSQKGGQRAVRHLDRDVVEGDEVAELLPGLLDDDAHQDASFRLNEFIASRVAIAISANTSEAV